MEQCINVYMSMGVGGGREANLDNGLNGALLSTKLIREEE